VYIHTGEGGREGVVRTGVGCLTGGIIDGDGGRGIGGGLKLLLLLFKECFSNVFQIEVENTNAIVVPD
jgi:hypothetical protein